MSKDNEWGWTETFTVINLVLVIVLGIFSVWNTMEINRLSKSSLSNDILPSSPQIDTLNKIGEEINITISLDSNYEGAMPIQIKLVEVKLDGEPITSDYKHSFTDQEEKIVKKDGSVDFNASFSGDKSGNYELEYIFYYDYYQKEDYRRGKSETYTLKMELER